MTVQESAIQAAAPGPGGPLEDDLGGESVSQLRQAVRRFVRSPMPMVALVFFVLVCATSFIAPYFYKWKFNEIDSRKNAAGNYIAQSLSPGKLGHPLGTDGSGFDLLARMMRGTQRDFWIVVISTAIALTIGITLGAVAGYFGKIADNLVMRFVDLVLCVPVLVILIIVASRYPGLQAYGLGVLLGLFAWMGLARLVRAEFLALREREYIEAAHAMGASNMRIIMRHLIPNAMSTILVFGTIFAAVSIIAETSLTYLGYGVHPPDTSLGLLISQGVDAAQTRPWLFYYPGILILLLVLAVNLIGEGIRNAFDPRHTRVRD